MNHIIYLFASGDIFFIGVAFVFAGGAMLAWYQQRWLTIAATILTVVGLLLVGLSSPPLPYWLYAVSVVLTLLWLVASRWKGETFQTYRKWLLGLAALLWLVCLAIEIPYHIAPTLPQSDFSHFCIIGDSVTAGMADPRGDTWPKLLARVHPNIAVVDLSQMGATVASAQRQADGLPSDDGLLLLEIGGNDVLGSTPVKKFEQDLEFLLQCVCKSGRTVMMFELPLPPFCNSYGRVQRTLAAKYGVVLIPKRFFIAVLSTPGATVDSIHLSPQGHEQMASVVWSLINAAYGG